MSPAPTAAATRTDRGYTILEVMIALTLLAIGMSGVIAMQKFAAVANRDAKNLAIADQIARTWIERLRTDAVGWNDPSPSNPSGNDLTTDTIWLGNVATSPGQWFQPAWNAVRQAGPAFDAQGNDVDQTDDAAPPAVFCTNVRLQWLYGTPPTDPPPYLIRAEVRVYWLREGPLAAQAICPQGGGNMTDIGQATSSLHFVYAASAIAQNPL